MLGRRQVPHEEDVVAPRKVLRILRAADQEAPLRTPPRRLDEKRLQPCLAIRRVGAEIGQVRREARGRLDRPVHVRIDMAVKRHDVPSAELGLQPIEGRSAGIAEHEVEIGEAARADIGGRLAAAETRQRDRRIEVVEHAHGSLGREHELARLDAVRTIGRDERDVGVVDILRRTPPDVLPFAVEDELAARHLEEIAGAGVIRHVLLVEDDAVAAHRQRAAQAPPEGRVAVPPRRADRQAEDDDLHAGTSFIETTLTPQSPIARRLIEAGPMSRRR